MYTKLRYFTGFHLILGHRKQGDDSDTVAKDSSSILVFVFEDNNCEFVYWFVHILKPGSSSKLLPSRKEGGAARRRLLSGCRQQQTGDWACAFFPLPQPTDCCVKRAAAAHYCGSQSLFQVRNLSSPRAGRPEKGCRVHTQGGRHQGTWVKYYIHPGFSSPYHPPSSPSLGIGF